MKKYLALTLLVLTPLLFLTSCATESKKELTYEWNITTTNGDLNQPVSKVELQVGGKKHLIIEQVDAPMENISKENFKNKAVPENAFMACSGFWAGYEQVIYLTKSESSIEAILLTIEEGFETPQKAPLVELDINSLNSK